MNLFLHGVEDFQVVRGDTLRNPAFYRRGGGLATFDCVIANPPFSLEEVGRGALGERSVGPQLRRRAARQQRRLRMGAAHGQVDGRRHRAHGRGAAPGRAVPRRRGGQIRQQLLELDLVEAVIGLAPNLFYGTGLAACILVLRQRKPQAQGARCCSSTRRAVPPRAARRTCWSPSTPPRSCAGVAAFADVEDRARVVDLDEIRSRGLDAQHLALRAAADRRRHPAAARSRRRVQGRAGDAAARPRTSLRRVMPREGGCRECTPKRTHPRASASRSWRPTCGAPPLLRGSIDAGDYKQFIFPLALLQARLRRLGRGVPAALAESGGDVAYASLRREPPLPDPRGRALERRARSRRRTSARRSRGACAPSRRPTPDTLDGVFGDAPWTNKDRLPDATLKDLIEHFSTATLSLANVPEDELGNGYEYLIKKFADDSGHTAQEFYTNRTLVHLMTLMLEPQAGRVDLRPDLRHRRHADLGAGRGEASGREHRNLRLYGQELNHMTSSIARMNLFLHGVDDFEIARGDTLAEPAFLEGDRLQTVRRGPRQSAVLHQAVEPRGVEQRPVGPQLPRHPAAGPRRLRLLPAHPRRAWTRRPGAARSSSRTACCSATRSRVRAQARRGRPRRLRARARAEPVLQLPDGGLRRVLPAQEAGGAPRARCCSSTR